MLRFMESKIIAGDFLVAQLSTILLRVCQLPPDTIHTRLWHSVACVEEALCKYLLIAEPDIHEYLSIFGLLRLLEYRIHKYIASSSNQNQPSDLPPITGLEPIVQRWIPKAAPALDTSVYEKYRLLITTNNPLGIRYLIGLADAFVHASHTDFRSLLQSLSRKRTEIELPTSWPIPHYVQTDRTDPVWFIWGILMHLWPKRSQQWLITKFKLFTWNYKGKTTKLARLGILCCIEQRMSELLATFTPSNENMEFSVADLHMIETCIEEGVSYMEKMEAQNRHNLQETSAKAPAAAAAEREKADLLYMTFVPRKDASSIAAHPTSLDDDPEPKLIELE